MNPFFVSSFNASVAVQPLGASCLLWTLFNGWHSLTSPTLFHKHFLSSCLVANIHRESDQHKINCRTSCHHLTTTVPDGRIFRQTPNHNSHQKTNPGLTTGKFLEYNNQSSSSSGYNSANILLLFPTLSFFLFLPSENNPCHRIFFVSIFCHYTLRITFSIWSDLRLTRSPSNQRRSILQSSSFSPFTSHSAHGTSFNQINMRSRTPQ